MECSKLLNLLPPLPPPQMVLRPSEAQAKRVAAAAAAMQKKSSSPPAPSSVGKTTDEVAVPTKKPRLDPTLQAPAPHVASIPKKPTAPPSDALVESWGVVKDLIPWVKHQLRTHPCVVGCPASVGQTTAEAVGETTALHQYLPLNIKASITHEADMASFQSPWDAILCKSSLNTTGLYQAGGNLMWLNPNPHGQCPSPPLCWAQVYELQKNLFEPCGEKAKLTTCGRIVFPETLHAYITDMGQLECAAAAGESQFPLLAGQGLVMAWWVAMFEALHVGADQQVAALWQCALTTTIQLHLESDVVKLMKASSQLSESLKLCGAHLTDTFPSFVAKLARTGMTLEASKVNQLRATGLRFNGAPINKTMVAAAGLMQKRFTPECHTAMTPIEFEFGRDLFANGYNKCMRIIQITEKQAEHLRCSVEPALEFFFLAALRMLQEDAKARKNFGMESLHNAKDGTGIVTTMLARMWLRDLCMDLVADLAKLDKPPSVVPELKKVMTWFSDFGAFTKEFPAAGAGKTAEADGGW